MPLSSRLIRLEESKTSTDLAALNVSALNLNSFFSNGDEDEDKL